MEVQWGSNIQPTTLPTPYVTRPIPDESMYQHSQMNIDGSSRSTTRRYNKTGRYSKKRSQQDDAQYQYPQQYYSSTYPNSQTPYYSNITSTSQYYSNGANASRSMMSRGIKRTINSIGIQRTPEEINHHTNVVQRFETAIKNDQIAVYNPDYKTPFRSYQDAVARLLPYNIFDYPDEDFKGNYQTSDLDATKLALKFYKKRKVIFDKYNDLIKKEAE
ncbi:22527_t:CDS:2, partial [Cetraspora pellucida]